MQVTADECIRVLAVERSDDLHQRDAGILPSLGEPSQRIAGRDADAIG